jgi:hypothetical protein
MQSLVEEELGRPPMRPDFTYDLHLAATAHAHAVRALQAMADPDDHACFLQLLHDSTITTFDFTLVLPPEPSIQQFAEWHPSPSRWTPAGMVRVGSINAWLKPQLYADGTPTLCLTLWPLTSSMQACLVQAPSFWQCLMTILEQADGWWGILDDSSGAPGACFWSRSAGRIPIADPTW